LARILARNVLHIAQNCEPRRSQTEHQRGRAREGAEWVVRVKERPIEAGIEVFIFEGVVTNKCVHGHLLREIVKIISTKEVDHSHGNQTDWTLVKIQSTANRIVTGGRRRVCAERHSSARS
jgi:hypothetical protein